MPLAVVDEATAQAYKDFLKKHARRQQVLNSGAPAAPPRGASTFKQQPSKNKKQSKAVQRSEGE